MKIISVTSYILFLICTLVSCKNGNHKADGYGIFEATEITISAEGNGKILQFNIDEGQQLEKDEIIGHIDTLPLLLKKEQLLSSKQAISSKIHSINAQMDVLKSQLKTATINQKRIENLVRENAGTQKQLDDINGEVLVLNQQIKSVETQNAPILNDLKSMEAQIKQLEDQLQKNKIVNPINGTVLVKYTEPNEITSFGKPLYKIADLNNMQLKVYISETQLPTIKIGQTVTVKIDTENDMNNYQGIVSWISSEAEFTPKIIQTKEERINLVYAVKINVKNDGSLKIGMPAEMWIDTTKE